MSEYEFLFYNLIILKVDIFWNIKIYRAFQFHARHVFLSFVFWSQELGGKKKKRNL